MLAVQAAGQEITTAEGLAAGGEMHPVQEAFRQQHGLQCGFCTPGMVMAATGLLAENPHPTETEVRRGPGRQFLPVYRLSQHRPGRARSRGNDERMIPAPFEYEAAESARHALDLLARHGDDAKVLAGGHSLLPMMKLRLAVPSVVIDIGRVGELAGIRADGDDLVIGATTCHADVAASGLVRSQTPLLAYAAAQVGDPQIRHRGTIGGSLAHADPAADLPMALVALGGSMRDRRARRAAHSQRG